ncbi:glutathione S-transferase family protein [Lysobacter sp. A3-1-A15]|uniref:glutathione S-transferase family protein n=1 Tax=Novilysobacter viscosus TaxID=3098602 RepID=UPI002EDB6041
MNRQITFFYAPQTRASGTLALLEALGAEYDIHMLDLKAGTQRDPAYLAVNPMGKVPAIRHGDAVVTEQVAVMLYLADLYAERGLAPGLEDPLRGPYLRWMAFYGSCFEPAVVDRSLEREAGEASSSGYGSYDHVMDALAGQLGTGPWLLGERFTAADVLWGTALKWTLQFGLVPDRAVFRDYVERVAAVPAIQRAAGMDEAHAARLAA